jgi:cystathionine beta-lyase/cystathionine gamma-synthase
MHKDLSHPTHATRLVSAGRPSEPGSALNVPLVPASNFIIGGKHEYARDDGTPTWEALEEIVGGLESGQAVAFASGMAAIAAVFDQLHTGSLVALPDDCYQGVAGLVAAGAERGRWRAQRIAVDDTAGWIAACATADLVWLESPSNPLLTVADLQAICAAPRKPGTLVAVDSTLATPLNQRPLEMGASVSIQSATKFSAESAKGRVSNARHWCKHDRRGDGNFAILQRWFCNGHGHFLEFRKLTLRRDIHAICSVRRAPAALCRVRAR